MTDLSDFKRRVYEPEVAALRQRIATLERERDEALDSVVLYFNKAENLSPYVARADRYEKALEKIAADQDFDRGWQPGPLSAGESQRLARAALAGEDA